MMRRCGNRKVVSSLVAIIIAIICLVSILLIANVHRKAILPISEGDIRLSSESISLSLSSVKLPPIIVVGQARNYVNVTELKSLNVRVLGVNTLGKISRISANRLVIVLHINDLLKSGPSTVLMKLIKITSHVRSFQVIVLNPEKSSRKWKLVLPLLLKLLGYYNASPIIPCSPVLVHDKKQACEIHPAVFRAAALAVSYNPTGFIVIENLYNTTEDILCAVKMYVEKPKLETRREILNELSTRSASFNITRLKGFRYIGYIGWLEANATGKVCHEVTGKMWIKVEYYIATEKVGDVKYEWFLAYVVHVAKGLTTTCNGATYVHTPEKFVDVFNWETSNWPGQVLWDWGPKNEGGPQTTISYTVTAGAQGAQVSISYSVTTEGSAFEWYNNGDPGNGTIVIVHELLNGKPDRLYTVEPSSIGLLDPTRPGGFEPMILCQEFKTIFTYGDTAKISLCTYLYHNKVEKVS